MSLPHAAASCCSKTGAGKKRPTTDRRLLIAAAATLVGLALWFGWPWLVVAGLAPLIIAVAPCLIMCGAMCAVKACCKPSATTVSENPRFEGIKTIDLEATKPVSSVASVEFSEEAPQTTATFAEPRVMA